jgi:hypothetical protein
MEANNILQKIGHRYSISIFFENPQYYNGLAAKKHATLMGGKNNVL